MRFKGQRPIARAGLTRGQSLVEFALVLPIILILVMAIVDFARLYTTMLTVESAAREAADYGAFHWYNWQSTESTNLTASEMRRRACVAARNLPDYAESGGTCTNPAFAYSVDPPPSGPTIDCSVEPSPSDDPCRVTVTLTYDFHLFAPLSLELGGTHLGLPSSLSFSRDSTFAISNFGIDNP
jgi:Flp pilus assembly protein TadG